MSLQTVRSQAGNQMRDGICMLQSRSRWISSSGLRCGDKSGWVGHIALYDVRQRARVTHPRGIETKNITYCPLDVPCGVIGFARQFQW